MLPLLVSLALLAALLLACRVAWLGRRARRADASGAAGALVAAPRPTPTERRARYVRDYAAPLVRQGYARDAAEREARQMYDAIQYPGA